MKAGRLQYDIIYLDILKSGVLFIVSPDKETFLNNVSKLIHKEIVDKQRQEELIKDLIHNVNENIIYSSNNGLNEDIYLRFFDNLDEKKYTKYISEDYMKINNTWIYDVSTYRNEKNNIKNEYKIFSGLISIAETKNNQNFMIFYFIVL